LSLNLILAELLLAREEWRWLRLMLVAVLALRHPRADFKVGQVAGLSLEVICSEIRVQSLLLLFMDGYS